MVELSDESERFPTCNTHGYGMPTKYEAQRTTLDLSPSSKSVIFRFWYPPVHLLVGVMAKLKIFIFFRKLGKNRYLSIFDFLYDSDSLRNYNKTKNNPKSENKGGRVC